LGALRYRPSRYGENASKRKAGKQKKTSEAKFLRNLEPDFTHYLSVSGTTRKEDQMKKQKKKRVKVRDLKTSKDVKAGGTGTPPRLPR